MKLRGKTKRPPARTGRIRIGALGPRLQPGVYVFCSVAPKVRQALGVTPIAEFREREGLTLVLRRAEARRLGLPFRCPSRLITLMAPTALEDIGILAAAAGCLAEAGISLNAFSAFHHDHLFVPEKQGRRALALLQAAV